MLAAAVHHLKCFIGLAVKPADNKRSAQWPAVRAAWLREHPTCAACGTTKSLQVHHVRPFHLHPELELSPSNFITLCEGKQRSCHFTFGHGYNWAGFIPQVREDAVQFLDRVKVSNALSKRHGGIGVREADGSRSGGDAS